jgi:hypothetical protein
MNQEMYEEPGAAKRTRPNRLDQLSPQRDFTAQEMIDILKRSGYEVRKIDRGVCTGHTPYSLLVKCFSCETHAISKLQ